MQLIVSSSSFIAYLWYLSSLFLLVSIKKLKLNDKHQLQLLINDQQITDIYFRSKSLQYQLAVRTSTQDHELKSMVEQIKTSFDSSLKQIVSRYRVSQQKQKILFDEQVKQIDQLYHVNDIMLIMNEFWNGQIDQPIFIDKMQHVIEKIQNINNVQKQQIVKEFQKQGNIQELKLKEMEKRIQVMIHLLFKELERYRDIDNSSKIVGSDISFMLGFRPLMKLKAQKGVMGWDDPGWINGQYLVHFFHQNLFHQNTIYKDYVYMNIQFIKIEFVINQNIEQSATTTQQSTQQSGTQQQQNRWIVLRKEVYRPLIEDIRGNEQQQLSMISSNVENGLELMLGDGQQLTTIDNDNWVLNGHGSNNKLEIKFRIGQYLKKKKKVDKIDIEQINIKYNQQMSQNSKQNSSVSRVKIDDNENCTETNNKIKQKQKEMVGLGMQLESQKSKCIDQWSVGLICKQKDIKLPDKLLCYVNIYGA